MEVLSSESLQKQKGRSSHLEASEQTVGTNTDAQGLDYICPIAGPLRRASSKSTVCHSVSSHGFQEFFFGDKKNSCEWKL